MPISGWPQDLEQAPLSSTEVAKMRARVVSSYFMYLPSGFEDVLFGAKDAPGAKAFIEKHYHRLQGEIFTERFGEGSFIQKFILGRLSTTDVYDLLHNWKIQARIWELPATAEDEIQDPAIRTANEAAYRGAIRDLTMLWNSTYKDARKEVLKQLSTAKGLKRANLQRMEQLYTQMRNAQHVDSILGRPEPAINIASVNTREEAEASKRTYLLHRARHDRPAFWRATFTADTLASQLEASRHVLDIRRLASSATHSTMKSNHWAVSCDLLSQYVIGQRETDQTLRLFSPNVRVRWSAVLKEPKQKIYQMIRELHEALGFMDTALWGEWRDIPILTATAGSKRKADTSSGAGVRPKPADIFEVGALG
ncbi:hypothetical protein N0V94_004614 [Neodidymelliopsis sp. IMI 364377]|nr:hypothetical protein N0V94_004614 [Neodidymelliopsis sp. IMI 364377]